CFHPFHSDYLRTTPLPFGLITLTSYINQCPYRLSSFFFSLSACPKMNQTAEQWFWITSAQADLQIQTDGWPFRNVTIPEFYSLSEILSIKRNLQTIIRWVGSLIPFVGIFFTFCLIFTLWRQTFQHRNTFFAGMTIIAFLDLIFNITDAAYNFWYRKWK